MYNVHHQLRESPFGVTPDPHFYYFNAVYREAWATLRYGIQGRKGFIVIAGEAGTGKTTLLRKALHEFPANIKAAYIPSNTRLSFSDLFRLILKDLGLPISTIDKFELMEQLNQYLLDQFNRGNIVAVLIDEAQDLSLQCLEELRLLGNLETDKHKLLQIVLVGQPRLERKLNQPELLQLKQRVVLRCRLQPVEAGEVGPYIESRLQSLGRRSADLFEPEAIQKIAAYSKGFPRLINIICDNALLTAYAVSKFKVNAAMIDEVAADLDLAGSCAESEARLRTLTKSPEEKHSFGAARRSGTATLPVRSNPARRDASSGRYSGLLIGLSAAVVLVALLLGGFLYSQKGPLLALTSLRPIEAPNAIDGEFAAAPGSRSGDRQATPGRVSVQTPNVSATAIADAGPIHRAQENTSEQERSSALIKAEEKRSESPQRPDRRYASSTGYFFVAGASFVRSKPASGAEIIATLEPGTRISVAGRTGEYYRIRSLGPENIRGYVHQEDAFFERP